MKKVTYTLDDDTVASLERMARRLSMPKSRVVREAIRHYGEEVDRMSEEERLKMLHLFDEVTARIPPRPRAEVKKELAEIGKARRAGGRGTPPRKDR